MNLTRASKVAVVTGGARGLGLAIATELLSNGYSVTLASRSESELEASVAGLRASGADVHACAADVSKASDVNRLFDQTLSTWGRLDVLVNNAAVQGPIGNCADLDAEHWLDAVAINLGGVFRCTRAVLPWMIAQRSGAIINVSGGGATAPRPGFSSYAAAKAAVVRFTETVAEETIAHNVRIVAMAPGPMNTRMLTEVRLNPSTPTNERRQAEFVADEGGTPMELPARLVTFLCSADARKLSGRLVSAVHDPWERWRDDPASIPDTPWFTLRRLDPHTVATLPDLAK